MQNAKQAMQSEPTTPLSAFCIGDFAVCFLHSILKLTTDASRLHSGVQRNSGRTDVLLALGCAAASFAAYLATLCPLVGPGDSGELTLAAWQLGIAHPPGYALFTWLGRLATLLPFSEPALATNLLTALIAAAAVGFAFLAARQLGQTRPASVASALVLAFSSTFWTSSLSHEVYALAILFLILLILLALRSTDNPRLLPLAGFVLGLSAAHQPTSLLWLPGLVALVLARRPRLLPSDFWLLASAFVLGLTSSLGLLFLSASHPSLNWGSPDTFSRFLAHATASQYRDLALAADRATIISRLSGLPRTLSSEFGIPALLLALAGIVALFRSNRGLGLGLVLIILTAGFGICYLIPDYTVHLLPAFAALALAAGSGLDLLAGLLRRARAIAAVVLAAIAVLPAFILHLPLAREHRTTAFCDLGADLAASLPDSTVFVFGADVIGNTVRYARATASAKSDIALVSSRMLLSESYWRELRTRYPLPEFEGALRLAGGGNVEARLQLMLRTVLASMPGRPVYFGSELLTQWFFDGPLARDLRPAPQGIVVKMIPLADSIPLDSLLARDSALWNGYHLANARRSYRLPEFAQIPVTYALSRNNLGMFLFERGRTDAALGLFQMALEFPTPPEFQAAVRRNLARARAE